MKKYQSIVIWDSLYAKNLFIDGVEKIRCFYNKPSDNKVELKKYL